MDLCLPRRLVQEGKAEKILEYLSRQPVLSLGEGLTLAVIRPEEAFLAVLSREFMRGRIVFGLERIGEYLSREEKGLKKRGERVSRLVITSRDGSPRFFRNVVRLMEAHAPRVMGLVLEVDSLTLGAICGRKEGRPVKAAMINHKDGVAEILGALVI